jgi:glycosyltransferase involved in cell wall biosynthesis
VNWLFVHRNFPSQYVHIARYLAAAGHRVVFITQESRLQLRGVERITYRAPAPRRRIHPHLRPLAGPLANAHGVAKVAVRLKQRGFMPDLIAGHSGWGEILFLKEIWPTTPLLGYFELFYRSVQSDLDFDPEFAATADSAMRVRVLNAVNLLALDAVDWGQTPTRYQRSTYPAVHQPRITVVHEGVDTDRFRPDDQASVTLADGTTLERGDQVVTYCARGLEPYRGFHTLMRSLPAVLRRRPKAHVVLIGGDDACYGRDPRSFGSYREQMLDELGDRLDLERIHFVGRIPYPEYRRLLQVSAVHVYLTYPWVLSWSFVEAMAVGCLVIGSRTAPVEEVLVDEKNGFLVDFFDHGALAERICEALTKGDRLVALRTAARAAAIKRFDMKTVCLPAYLRLLARLTGGRRLLQSSALTRI